MGSTVTSIRKKIALLLVFSTTLLPGIFAQKQIYIPAFITSTGMNLNDATSQWCYARSVQTDNWIIFWEAGFGSDPSKATGDYYVNMDALKLVAEKSFATYVDTLRMAIRGSSITDKYKQMIFILYSTDWAAYGSGQDDVVGTLHVNPAAANIDNVLAHEIGHCFEYITGIDDKGGYRYGYGTNASGGNGFWEQCAQWEAFKVYPEQQFTEYDFNEYITSNHLHIIHETPRYANYFLPDYWAYKRGQYFMGRLWRESRSPEDPVETYKRLTAITQEQFNDEMFEHAARLTTWDLPAIKSYGANYINSRKQVKMNLTTDNFWLIDTSVCIQNYGYNSIKLNAPSSRTDVTVKFQGKAGATNFRNINVDKAGWRFGFVALLENGTRVYSSVGTAKYTNATNPDVSLTFTCPANCAKLWLVVSGSPPQHWRHPWDDNVTNDEQWPYQVQFTNTNLLGIYSNPIHDLTLTYNVNFDPRADYTSTPVAVNEGKICEAFAMPTSDIVSKLGSSVIYYAVNPDGTLNSTSTATAPGHWFSKTGASTSWGTSAYVFSELNLSAMIFNIGQYPSACKVGEKVTIKQALVYTKSATEKAQVTIIFNITIGAQTQNISLVKGWNLISINVHPTDSTIATLFKGLDVNELKTMDAFWRKSQDVAFNSLNTLTSGNGYLVYMNASGTLTVAGKPNLQGFQNLEGLQVGWQLIGCPFQSATLFSAYFNSTNCSRIKNFNGFWMPNGSVNSITDLEPGKGYYIIAK